MDETNGFSTSMDKSRYVPRLACQALIGVNGSLQDLDVARQLLWSMTSKFHDSKERLSVKIFVFNWWTYGFWLSAAEHAAWMCFFGGKKNLHPWAMDRFNLELQEKLGTADPQMEVAWEFGGFYRWPNTQPGGWWFHFQPYLGKIPNLT